MKSASALLGVCASALWSTACLEFCEKDCPKQKGGLDAAGGSGGEGGGGANSCPGCDVPAEATELATFLSTAKYATFESEGGVHASEGPHGQVRAFFGPKLYASLEAENESHPAGAGAVLVYYEGSSRSGFAAFVKTAESSEAGNAVYWYESTDLDGGSLGADGLGAGQCVGCHIASPRDFVLSQFPPDPFPRKPFAQSEPRKR